MADSIAVDWFAIVFNPSFPYRFAHMVCAAYITTGFVVLSVGAWLIRKGRFVEEGRLMFSITLWLLLVLVPLQIFLGDQHGLNTLEHQPAKLAAIEGDFKTETPTPLNLFAIPDQNTATNRFDIAIPRLGSLILTHSWNGTVKGLDQFPRQDWPTVIFPFFAFRIMVGVGFLMLALVIWGNWMRRGDRLFRSRPPAAPVRVRGAARLHRRHRRLGHDRDRAATVDGVRPAAHRRFRIALAHRLGRAGVAARLHHRLCRHLSRPAGS